MRKRLSGLATLSVAALGLCAVMLQPAKADTMYLGWDFGNGFGIGIGAPPSAYGMAPASPLYPFYAPYYYYPPRPYYYRYR